MQLTKSTALRSLMLLLLGIAMSHASVARPVVSIQKSDSLPATLPWDLASLSKAPDHEWGEDKEVRSLHFRGEPFKGNATRIFAYYATPGTLAGDLSLDKDLPGIVLVHGGGGRAFARWARLWASRGYAAIAMDLSGGREKGGPAQNDNVKFTDGPTTDQWSYHAVADVILAHSLLLSMPEVDPKRTALTGISWGGYLTCIVAGLDNRFKAAVPVYGCGFLHENSCWLKRFEGMEAHARQRWIQLWDPSNYVGSAQMPMLFVNGGKDFAYPPDSHAKTYALVQPPKNLHFVPDLKHGHIFDKPKAIEVFIDSMLQGGEPLPRIGPTRISEQTITATASGPHKLVNAQIHHSIDPLASPPRKRQWISRTAILNDHEIHAPLPPADTTIWFLTVEDESAVTVSSDLAFPNP